MVAPFFMPFAESFGAAEQLPFARAEEEFKERANIQQE